VTIHWSVSIGRLGGYVIASADSHDVPNGVSVVTLEWSRAMVDRHDIEL